MLHPRSFRIVVFAVLAVLAASTFPGVAARAQEDDRLLLHLQVPQVELTTDSEFNAAVLLDTQVDNVQGWSFGVANDPGQLEILGAEIGSTTATIKDGAPPDFLVVNSEPNVGTGVAMAVVIDFVTGNTLSAGTDYEILTMSYRVVADPTAEDPCTPVEAALAFSNELADPPVSTVVTVDGDTRIPLTQDGIITVRCPGTLEFTRCEGDTENVYLEWTFSGSPTWDFLFLYRDGELIANLESTATSYTDEGLEPGDYTYTLVTFVVADPTQPALVFDACTATVIPVTITSVEPALGYWLGGDEITVRGTAFTTLENTTLTFFDGEESLPLEVLEVVSETELRAVTPQSPRLGFFDLRVENERGSAEFPDAFEYGFIRAEANADGAVDMSDSVFILGFLYLGTESPVCLNAADVNDDGIVDISDGIWLLSYLFIGGGPPPAPFPAPGSDPTAGDLSCLETVAP